MGLLDDAIHEHLEFRRLRGADPSEVLREEREAFGPALGGEPAEHAADFEEPRAARTGHAAEVQTGSDLSSQLSQETVEFDMLAVLEAESIEGNGYAARDPARAISTAPSRAGVGYPASEGGSTGDSLEWEMPGERLRGFGGRPFEEAPAPRRRIVDTRAPAPVEVPAGMPDSVCGASDQESLWLDRRPAQDVDFDFER